MMWSKVRLKKTGPPAGTRAFQNTRDTNTARLSNQLPAAEILRAFGAAAMTAVLTQRLSRHDAVGMAFARRDAVGMAFARHDAAGRSCQP